MSAITTNKGGHTKGRAYRDFSEMPPDVLRALANDFANPKEAMRRIRLANFDGGMEYIPADMFVDEMGHPNGLPRNEAATIIYRNATMMGRSGVKKPKDPEELPCIVGPSILFDRRVWF